MAKAIRTDIAPENLIHMCWAVWDATERVERIDDIEDKTDLIIDFAKEFLNRTKLIKNNRAARLLFLF